MSAVARSVLHPFLLGLYFVLTLAASNASELMGTFDLAWQVLTSLLVCTVLWLAAWALSRELQEAAILAGLWLIGFSTYGYVAETLRAAGTLKMIGDELGLGIRFFLGLFGPSLAIHRSTRRLEPVNRYLSLVALLLLAYTTLQLSQYLPCYVEDLASLPLPRVNRAPAGGDRPDIYLIILDKCTGSEVLAQHFGFDNSEFETFLRDRGFLVPLSSHGELPADPPRSRVYAQFRLSPQPAARGEPV